MNMRTSKLKQEFNFTFSIFFRFVSVENCFYLCNLNKCYTEDKITYSRIMFVWFFWGGGGELVISATYIKCTYHVYVWLYRWGLDRIITDKCELGIENNLCSFMPPIDIIINVPQLLQITCGVTTNIAFTIRNVTNLKN